MHARSDIVKRMWSALWLATLFLASGTLVAQSVAAARGEQQIKAAYVLNFLRYTQWPELVAAADPIADRVLAVIGSEAFVDELSTIAEQAAQLGQRRVRVYRVDPAKVRTLFSREGGLPNAVFIEATAWNQIDRRVLLTRLSGSPVLTVGDGSDFAGHGGMLGLVPDKGRIVFEANPRTIQASGLQVSAKLLKLARIVASPQ